MKYHTWFGLVLTMLAFTVSPGTALADLDITISPGGGGSTVIEMVGTGTITANTTNTGDTINIITSSDTFVVNGTTLQDFSDLSPSLNLGNASTNRIFVEDMNGYSGSGSTNIHSRLGFGPSIFNFVSGNNASDMNGTYTTALPFSVFVPGTYFPILGFPSTSYSLTNIGNITLTVVAPEPAAGAILFAASGLLLSARRRRGANGQTA